MNFVLNTITTHVPSVFRQICSWRFTIFSTLVFLISIDTRLSSVRRSSSLALQRQEVHSPCLTVAGSIIPSLITILSNSLSLRWIISIRHSIDEQSSASRRRTDETRRVIIIITVECLLAVINSWFIDILLSIKHCGHSVVIGDDCPYFLRRSQVFLAVFDLLNSMSNIVLYCYAGRRFRHELKRMIGAWWSALSKRLHCYCRIEWHRPKQPVRTYAEPFLFQSHSPPRPSKAPLGCHRPQHQYIQLRVISHPTNVL